MRCVLTIVLGTLFTAIFGAGTVVSHEPRQAPPPRTTVREIPGTPDKVFVQPGTPGVRETIAREEIPPPPATVHYLPQAAPVKVKHAMPAYYEAPTYYAPPVRYAAPTYYAAPVVTYRAAPVYVAPAYAVYGKTPVGATYGPFGGLRTVNYADGSQHRRGLVQRTVGFFIGD